MDARQRRAILVVRTGCRCADARNPTFSKLKGFVQDSGEGRWMIADAIEKDVPVPALTTALFTRSRSRQPESFSEKMLAALRNAFGGHAVER